jgi:hypothetical protein
MNRIGANSEIATTNDHGTGYSTCRLAWPDVTPQKPLLPSGAVAASKSCLTHGRPHGEWWGGYQRASSGPPPSAGCAEPARSDRARETAALAVKSHEIVRGQSRRLLGDDPGDSRACAASWCTQLARARPRVQHHFVGASRNVSTTVI